MFNRIALEQLRRFEKLMDFGNKHAQSLAIRKCGLEGKSTYFPSNTSSRGLKMSHIGFYVAGLEQPDEDMDVLTEGIIGPASPKVLIPPVERLASRW